MRVVGQFNKGFIIGQRRREASSTDEDKEGEGMRGAVSITNDLFILDQHACDEKFRYVSPFAALCGDEDGA